MLPLLPQSWLEVARAGPAIVAAVERVEVAVVGAGVMGSAAARALAARGVPAVLLEQFELGHARGSSHGANRIFRFSYPDPVYVRMAVSAREEWRVASAELTRVLRLDPRAVVEPLEHDHLQITLIDPSRSLDQLMPIALKNRPELASHQALVQAMLVATRQEKLRPLLPSLFMNGFQTPYELIEAGANGIGKGGKINQWSPRDDLSPEMFMIAQGMGFRNLAMVKEARGMSSQAIVELFHMQDSIAAGVTRTQADLQSAAARVVQAEREVKSALINYNGNLDGLSQIKRFGNIVEVIFRPQEVVFALQLLMTAYDNYISTVAEYNTAQFAMFHELGYPAREISFLRRPGAVVPVNTSRPNYLPPVGTGAPPATR